MVKVKKQMVAFQNLVVAIQYIIVMHACCILTQQRVVQVKAGESIEKAKLTNINE